MSRPLKKPAEALVALMIEATEDLETIIHGRRLEGFPDVHGSVLHSSEVKDFLTKTTADRPWTREEWDGFVKAFNFAARISDATEDVDDWEVSNIHDDLDAATVLASRVIGDLLHGAGGDDKEGMTDADGYPLLLFPA